MPRRNTESVVNIDQFPKVNLLRDWHYLHIPALAAFEHAMGERAQSRNRLSRHHD
jgi:hypothetical protein